MSEATGADRVQAEARPFQVDLRGVVDLLSRHIYSSPRVYLRELLQNGRDAIEARRAVDPDGDYGVLSIEPARDGEDFVFTDDGVGLTRDEAEELLATVGRSSKRDDVLSLRREEFLGQFGIGLLSCFMVSDSILVRSRSARGGAPVEWLGRADGTFLVRELNGADAASVAVGTTVRLTPRPDDRSLLSDPVVSRLAALFGEYLPADVRVRAADGSWTSLSRRPAFLDPVGSDPSDIDDALLELGRDVVGATPLGVVGLESRGTRTRGVAFVLPYAPPPGAHQASRVYLGRMLLGERVADVLPDWAFFVRCVLDTTGLVPTASREQLVDGPELEDTRAELGAAVRRWVLEQAAARPGAFARFLEVHQLGLKSLAVHDDELAATIVPMLSVDTSDGVMTIAEHLARSSELAGTPTVRYTETVDEFRQIAAIAPSDAPIVNGGYAYDAELLRRLPEIVPGARVERVTVSAELDNLQPPPLDDRDRAVALESRASAALSSASCTVVVRLFEPDGISSLYVADPEVLRRIERGKAKDAAPALWASLLDEIDDVMVSRFDGGGDGAPTARLCLNWANRLVRTLAGVDDEVVFERSIHLLYAQAMLAGHRPLGPADRALLTTAMTDLVHLSVGLGPDAPPDETPHDKDDR